MRGVRKGERQRSAFERVMLRVILTESGCWEFTGSKQEHGHGLVRSRVDVRGPDDCWPWTMLATHAENTARQYRPSLCPAGHDTTVVGRKPSNGGCRECSRSAGREYWRRKSAKRKATRQ